MPARIVNALVFGLVFVLLLDFVFFVGVWLHYFKAYGVDTYFNVLFFDAQRWWVLLIVAPVVGYLMLYGRWARGFERLWLGLFVLVALTFYPPVGKWVGEWLFMQRGVEAKVLDKRVCVDILYRARDGIYLKRCGGSVAHKYGYDEVLLLNPLKNIDSLKRLR